MTRYSIDFRAVPGKSAEAMQLFSEMKEYFQKTHQKTLDVYYQAFGTPGTFQATMDFDTLSELETLAQSIRRDPQYKSLSDRARSLFTSDSFGTTVYYRL